MRRLVLAAALLLLAAASSARAQDVPPAPPELPVPSDPAAARKEAIDNDRRAREAWNRGDAAAAARLWERAARCLPGEPSLDYNAGVAKERSGDVEGAVESYESALTGSAGEVESNALFNASSVHLGKAWDALAIARAEPEELAQLLAGQPGPDGKPLAPEHVAQAAQTLKQQAAKEGIEAAKKSLGHLRDLVRRDTTDRDALHNLELTQRVRKDLRLELEKLEQQQQNSDQQNQQQKDESDNENSGKQEDQDEQPPEDQQQQGEGQDDAEQQQQQDGQGEQDQPQEQDAEKQQAEGKAENPSQEQAERLLEQMLENAQRRAREVREAREIRARRAPVEKDW